MSHPLAGLQYGTVKSASTLRAQGRDCPYVNNLCKYHLSWRLVIDSEKWPAEGSDRLQGVTGSLVALARRARVILPGADAFSRACWPAGHRYQKPAIAQKLFCRAFAVFQPDSGDAAIALVEIGGLETVEL